MKLKLIGIFALTLTLVISSCKEEEIESTTDTTTNTETPTGVDCENYLFGGDSHRLTLSENPLAVVEPEYNYKMYIQNSDECEMDIDYRVIEVDLDSAWSYQFCLGVSCYSFNLLNKTGTIQNIHADSSDTKYNLKCKIFTNGVSGTGRIAVQLTDAEYTQYIDTAYFDIDLP